MSPPEIDPKWYEIREGLPHPRWKSVHLKLRKQPEDRQAAELSGFCCHWLDQLAAVLGPPYAAWGSPHFLLLTPQDPPDARTMLASCEWMWQQAMSLLGSVASPASATPICVILYQDRDSYYQHLSAFTREGRQGASGGVYVSDGPGHIVSFLHRRHDVHTILAHELTHFLTVARSWPRWLEEGMAEVLPQAICGRAKILLDWRRAKEHATFWRRARLGSFWSGAAFTHASRAPGLSYELAEVLTTELALDRARFTAFLKDAHYADAGAAAAREHLELTLGEVAGAFLGGGDWEPTTADGRGCGSRAWGLAAEGRYEAAVEECGAALRIDPGRADSLNARAWVRMRLGQFAAAIPDLELALQCAPDDVRVHNNLAWLLATAPDAAVRDGRRALDHAQRAHAAARPPEWWLLGTLGAAHAECGDFGAAEEWTRRALAQAPKQEHDRIHARLAAYAARQPVRDGGVDPDFAGG